MKRTHGLVLAVAIGLAAIAGTYAALQTTDLGAQASTMSKHEVAAAQVRLNKQEAALRRAAAKRPPQLPKLPHKVSAPTPSPAAPAPAAAPAIAAAPAPSTSSFSSSPSASSGPSGWKDNHGDNRSDDDHSGHGGGGDNYHSSDDGGGEHDD
jgi:hypothetical protein